MKTHLFCKSYWQETKKEIKSKSRFKALKAGSGYYTVYENSVKVWYGVACCKWDARTRALEGTES